MIECEFCGNEVTKEDSVACQYCDGVFCDSNCFDAHLVCFPRCGGKPTSEIVAQAHKRIFGEEI